MGCSLCYVELIWTEEANLNTHELWLNDYNDTHSQYEKYSQHSIKITDVKQLIVNHFLLLYRPTPGQGRDSLNTQQSSDILASSERMVEANNRFRENIQNQMIAGHNAWMELKRRKG